METKPPEHRRDQPLEWLDKEPLPTVGTLIPHTHTRLYSIVKTNPSLH